MDRHGAKAPRFLGPHRTVAADPDGAREHLEALVGLLGEERDLLERLVHKLAAAAMLIEAGEDEFVARAVDEVVETEDDVGALELARAMLVADICDLLGFAGEVTLTQLARHVPEGLEEAFERRRVELGARLADIDRYRARARRAAEERLERVAQGIEGLERLEGGYEARTRGRIR
ncbi:MAG TPA: hypothetical protein ENK55_08720 [Actinobacteria bacterium]|nr:hypothetical protein [Actinomycetota bacterium]